jgi:NADPH:quinone reductase-like Zn-dependent oxidoreductase
MLALTIQRAGSPIPPNIALVEDWPDPDPPGPGQARIRTLATALNQLDLWVARGAPGLNLPYPRISGCDACGVVESVGPGVDAAWVGRRVIVNAAVEVPRRARPDDPPATTLAPEYELIGEHTHGMHCEAFLAPAANLAPVPDGTDPVEAGAFGLTFLTAYSMMMTKARLAPGQSVLITGIGGGVALAALAIATHLGCPTIVTSRHEWKLDRAKALGASVGVLDTGNDWSKLVRAATGKRGVDLAVDSSGKATHLNCIRSLARGGTYVSPGCTSGPDATTDLARLFWNQLRLLGSTMGSNDEFAEVASLFRAGRLRPVVDRVFDARRGEGADAFARLESAEQFGKVVLRWT